MGRQGKILLPGERSRGAGLSRRPPAALLPLSLLVLLLLFPHLEGMGLPRPGGGGVDAVVVLAGGENRIREGVRLFLGGAGRELHILGAGRGTTAARVVPGYESIPEGERRRIFLETWSENTLENAASLKSIVLERGIRSLVLVTSDYHVPRAARAVAHVLPPSVRMSVVPVRGERREKGWFWKVPRLFLGESVKYWGFRLLLPFE